jgi:RNA polymerase sigma-70 factor (ECF subfamily)
MDVCQSVLGSFFVRAAKGQYDVDTPEQVEKLLVRWRGTSWPTRWIASGPPVAITAGRDDGVEGRDIVGGVPTPSREAGARDALGKVRRLLTEEEMQLLQLREAGHDWAEIAQMMNGSAEALRKKLARALERVAEQLGPQEIDG